MDDFATVTLAGSGLTRRPWVREAKREADYLQRFDAATLWLDAVWTGREVRLICPRLNNLRRAVTGAGFALDGRPVRARFRHYDRHCIVSLAAPAPGARVSVRIGDWQAEGPVSLPDPRFDGKNVLLTLSKNNDPGWIEDWARFHVHHHGAEAAVFVDNGSDYGPEVAEAALRRGGVEPLVLVTRRPFGPRGKKPFANAELFLQFAVLNAVRWRYLQGARAVLNCDVDELVMSPGGSVFDRAVHSRFGYVAFPGRWVYPAPEVQGQTCHGAHDHVDVPPKRCPDKWCMVPSGPLRGYEWRQHMLERLPLPKAFRQRGVWFYHCRAVTDGWKSPTRARGAAGTVPDPDLRAALEAAGLPMRSA